MTEQQEICQDCWGSGWATQFIMPCPSCKGTGKILPSPIPHQDGASAEDVLKSFNDGQFKFYYSVNDCLKAMHQFAQSETAKVVAEKDREIAEWESLAIADHAFIVKLQSYLSTAYASACSAPSSIWEDDYNKLTGIAAWFLNEDEGDFERPAAEYLLGLRSRLSERKIVLPTKEDGLKAFDAMFLDVDSTITFGDGWNAAIESIKRLNGIN